MPDPPLEAIDAAFTQAVQAFEVAAAAGEPSARMRPPARLTGERALELFDSQLQSRHLDLAARWLRARNTGFYTIGSSGHEGNVAIAAALRVTDPALLHYRSGGFYAERARMHVANGHVLDPVRDVLLGIVASTDEPIAGGRHKVFGNAALQIIPQTSTIASHLPRAVGLALSIERAKKLDVACKFLTDSIVVCSFGDASANHSTAAGAINAACHCAHQHLPLPILFVCEDNGIGISVQTPSGWIAAAYGSRPGLRYFEADGLDIVAAFEVAQDAADYVRRERGPAFIRLATVRLMGHAGSDLETAYRRPDAIERDIARDPLVQTARMLVASGVLTREQVVQRYEQKRAEILEAARWAERRPVLKSVETIMAPLAPRRPPDVQLEAARRAPDAQRRAFFDGAKLPEEEGPLTLALAINRSLADLLVKYPELLVFGEDVGRKGGVYGVTRGLIKKAGAGRVFDTLLDEQSILGFALGAGVAGFLPIPEIQYLAYLHNAEDQLRGEAATLSFFSNGQYRNPLVIRIAGYGYQKGFGGHFHNDDAVAVLRDIPGLVIASPSRPDDAAAMLRTCVAAARVDGSVCVFLEPIALYHTRDLYEEGDGAWLAPYSAPSDWTDAHAPIGRGRTALDGSDLTLVTFANGLYMSLRVARRLEREHGVRCRVLDLRWLSPLPVEDLLREANVTGKVLVVDETRKSGAVAEAVIAALVDAGFAGRMQRVNSHDSFVPLGDAALQVLLSEATIFTAALALMGKPATARSQ